MQNRSPLIRPLKGYKERPSRLQSISATASLLIKSYQCIREEIKLIVFLAQTLLKPAGGNRDA